MKKIAGKPFQKVEISEKQLRNGPYQRNLPV
jgi:hypothetical protein